MKNEYSNYQRYLASKKSVDDRALNHQVWRRLGNVLKRKGSIPTAKPLRVLELGSGIGTMLERLLDNEMLISAEYVAVDELAANAQTAMERFQGREAVRVASSDLPEVETPRGVSPESTAETGVTLYLETADLFDYLARAKEAINAGSQHPFDLIIAHAFLDLVDASAALAQIKGVMQPKGTLFTSINFDGATILQPEVAPELDAHIESLYHRTMDERIINGALSGESKTGRHLFGHLRDAGFIIQEAGASDWVVFAMPDEDEESGPLRYQEDEAYFLHFIVETMHGALAGHPELDGAQFEAWVAQRHRQIETRELVYIAHQLDFLAEAFAPK